MPTTKKNRKHHPKKKGAKKHAKKKRTKLHGSALAAWNRKHHPKKGVKKAAKKAKKKTHHHPRCANCGHTYQNHPGGGTCVHMAKAGTKFCTCRGYLR